MTEAPKAAFRLEVQDGVAVLTFDLPGSPANTLGQPVLAELEPLVPALTPSGESLRGLILRSGKPSMFIAGADLRELGASQPDPAQTRATVQRGLDLFARLEALPYPTVAVIDGPCLGGGLELALSLD